VQHTRSERQRWHTTPAVCRACCTPHPTQRTLMVALMSCHVCWKAVKAACCSSAPPSKQPWSSSAVRVSAVARDAPQYGSLQLQQQAGTNHATPQPGSTPTHQERPSLGRWTACTRAAWACWAGRAAGGPRQICCPPCLPKPPLQPRANEAARAGCECRSCPVTWLVLAPRTRQTDFCADQVSNHLDCCCRMQRGAAWSARQWQSQA
jgi:hypothetical protein